MITLTFDSSDMNREIADVAGRLEDSTTVHDIIGEVLLDETRERITKEVGPDGSNWPALHPVTLDNRRSKTGMLRDSGELFRSIHKNSSAAKAEVGTNLNHPKVWVNQYGTTIKPRRVPFLLIPFGGGRIAAKQVTIPARPYIGIGRDDAELIRETLERYLEE
ncbi:phage virion morphogenesis protein [Pseudovibrio sp. Tun.PSC04-5.I4]|uniref:phage virion morphogenesis protein n=1 Tax=Pseudovibrio sp. Tun.PSC04-5.I4 TaxID=1798213 RepID=UPI00087E89CD|nr:phage virion morphogenesis protein [Pseudovibrio sp. Tun.PSC04-5.I4]SDQ17640.1 Phage virion morphogenesis family protein [Pseudovibrio sp. Tun.PSC04-5.I4]